MTLESGNIIRHIMVNLAYCTKIIRRFLFIHNIHRDLSRTVQKLSPSPDADFRGKLTYAQSYPQYPQRFPPPRQFRTGNFFQKKFCSLLINFHISTIIFSFPLDKNVLLSAGRKKKTVQYFNIKLSYNSRFSIEFFRHTWYTIVIPI